LRAVDVWIAARHRQQSRVLVAAGNASPVQRLEVIETLGRGGVSPLIADGPSDECTRAANRRPADWTIRFGYSYNRNRKSVWPKAHEYASQVIKAVEDGESVTIYRHERGGWKCPDDEADPVKPKVGH